MREMREIFCVRRHLLLGTLSSGNADGDADAEIGEKIGERTPL